MEHQFWILRKSLLRELALFTQSEGVLISELAKIAIKRTRCFWLIEKFLKILNKGRPISMGFSLKTDLLSFTKSKAELKLSETTLDSACPMMPANRVCAIQVHQLYQDPF